MNEVGGVVRTRPYRMTSRAEATRETAIRVLDVAVELFTEKSFEDVSLDEVAGRAQVTKRTVLRRFDSKDGLFAAAMQHAAEEMVSQRGTAPVGDIAKAVANLMDHYERWGTNRLRLLAQEERITVVADHVEAGRRYHWSWVEQTFAPLIAGLEGDARRRRVAALVAVTDVYTWKLLRRDLALSRANTERIVIELISKLAGAE